MILSPNEIESMRMRLEAWTTPDGSSAHSARMWRHTLDHYAAPSCDGSGALPYVPIEPEALGMVLSENDEVLDVGCLGGYGLFDWTCRRRQAKLPLPKMTGADVDSASVELGRWMTEHGTPNAEGVAASSSTRPPMPSSTAAESGKAGTMTFVRADAERLPFPDATLRIVIARLLLPYTNMDAAMREMARVLSVGGALYVQAHGPRYYKRQWAKQARRRPQAQAGQGEPGQAERPGIGRRWATALYYLRPLPACAWMRLTGRQPQWRRFRETAMTEPMLRRLAERHGLTDAWSARDPVRPFAVYRRSG